MQLNLAKEDCSSHFALYTGSKYKLTSGWFGLTGVSLGGEGSLKNSSLLEELGKAEVEMDIRL